MQMVLSIPSIDLLHSLCQLWNKRKMIWAENKIYINNQLPNKLKEVSVCIESICVIGIKAYNYRMISNSDTSGVLDDPSES